jgi:hypothetical protein
MTEKKEKPETIRVGRIKAKIWRNVAKDKRVWFNVEFVRTYTEDGDPNVKEATQFGMSDLLTVAKVANMAHDWIWGQERSPAPSPEEIVE